MKRLVRALPVLLTLALPACASAPAAAPGTGGVATPGVTPDPRAQRGDTVYVVQHYVRPERRQQFEEFVSSVLWPAFRQVAASRPEHQRAIAGIRLLTPVQPDGDGVYTYTFILDPYVAGWAYNIYDVLREVHPAEVAQTQYGRFTEMWARDFTSRAFIQATDAARQ
jgi:hypothetical protein